MVYAIIEVPGRGRARITSETLVWESDDPRLAAELNALPWPKQDDYEPSVLVWLAREQAKVLGGKVVEKSPPPTGPAPPGVDY